MLADCEFTCNKNSASLTFHFGHHKGIAGFIFTIKDTIVLINKNKWFSGKFRIAQSVNHKNGEMCCISKCDFNLLVKIRPSTNIYLNDSMPFFVALTKNGNLSILVMSTSPPLLSMTPKWIAALQILDCWNDKKKQKKWTVKLWV